MVMTIITAQPVAAPTCTLYAYPKFASLRHDGGDELRPPM